MPSSVPIPESQISEGSRPWIFTIVRAHGLHHLRAGKSWRPIVTVAVGDRQCYEWYLGCDGQNPNLKECFEFKKKSKQRHLVANACCTLQELARLQAQQQCEHQSVEIKLNRVSRQQKVAKKGRAPVTFLVAKLEVPEFRPVPASHSQENVLVSDIINEEESCSSSTSSESSSESSAEPAFTWPELPLPSGSKICPSAGYWPDSDSVRSEDERDPLLNHQDNEPIFTSHSSDAEESDRPLESTSSMLWSAESILPTYTEAIAVNQNVSIVDSIVDSFSPYRELREARVDSDYERVLTKLQAEWSSVGASLLALAGLEAAVFGFSSGSLFTVDSIAKRAIAVGAIASGIGLSVDAWFILAYSDADPAKFRKMALDIYGKYFFGIDDLPVVGSVVRMATAVLVISFVAGVLVGLQFIVYGVHCVVVFVGEVIGGIRRGEALADVSPDSGACTMHSKEYQFQVGPTSIRLWDTVGLEEPEKAANGYVGAIEKAIDLIQRLNETGGISLFLFCIRGNRVTATTQSNYRLFYEVLGKKQVPIALAITHLERETEMEDWWDRNVKKLEKSSIVVAGHACLTTLEGNQKYSRSREVMQDLLLQYDSQMKFTMPSEAWMGRLLKGLGSLAPDKLFPRGKDLTNILTKRCHLDAGVAQRVAACIESSDV
ncbi:hypothetical protein BU15DRAFT_64050 [Melanogaster broomeanus]|nr:hypothetical protein BU15DRAFT_64050 [Melanogaster broomeanus]